MIPISHKTSQSWAEKSRGNYTKPHLEQNHNLHYNKGKF